MKRLAILTAAMILGGFYAADAGACTGISLVARDGSHVVARTVEWAATPMQCGYVVVPRGHDQQSYTPTGANGLKYKAKYGYVGIYTEYEPFIVEGINEAGLVAGLFFFPNYGDYAPYDRAADAKTLCDMQFVSWVLSQFSSIDQVKEGIKNIDLVTLNHNIGAVHWRIAEPNGRMVVLEVVNGVPHFYENTLGVLTNAPGFNWHMTNLNNYINLSPGRVEPKDIGRMQLRSISGGTGLLGLPGDFSAPSRFVRAAFLQSTAPVKATAKETVVQAFHILNNFDIPIGTQYATGDPVVNLPSATQFTAVSDLQGRKLYWKTMHNSEIRCIDLSKINFAKVRYISKPLDTQKCEPIHMIEL